MSRVAILNPPGSRNYIRDYFCSKLSKSRYKSPPIVMLMLSGILAEEHEVMILDAIVEAIAPEPCVKRLQAWRPDVVVTLVGAASWDEDRAFLKQLKHGLDTTVIAIGDVLLEDTEARMREAPEIDAALFNFVTPAILTLISGRSGQPIPNTCYRFGSHGEIINGGLRKSPIDFRVPRPRHEWFPLARYRFPFMVGHPLTAMLTDYGCPFTCSFCVIPTLGFGLRPLEDLKDELRALHELKVREIFFLDQTFGVRQDRTLALCKMLEEFSPRFHWSCFSRADVLNAELLSAMARAGCHTIIFGVESGSDETLAHYHKKMNLKRIRETLAACRAAGIRVAATFMLGLPGETERQARATIRLALELPLDYVAFNVAIPRAGTELRAQSIASGLIDADVKTMDQSGIQGAMSTREMSAAKVLQLRREAIRRFYLRPAYLLRRLLTLRSWWDLRAQVVDGVGVLMDGLRWK